MLDEKEIEELSQNQSSLSDNVYESKNIESPQINYLPEDNSPKKNLMDSNEMNNNFGQIIFEEKKDASNSKIINENKILEEDSDKDNINNFEIESNDLSTPNTFLDNTRQKRNENPKPNLKMIENNHTEQNSTSIINVEYKYKYENKDIPKKSINFDLSNAEVNVPHLNFSYNDENNINEDNCKVNNNDNNIKNLNNNIYQGKKNILNNKYEKDNIDEKIEVNSQNDNEENKENNIKVSNENSFNNGNYDTNMKSFNNENKIKEKNKEMDNLNKTEKTKKSNLNLSFKQKDIIQNESKECNSSKVEKKDLSKINNDNVDIKKDEEMIKVNKAKLNNEFEKTKNENEKGKKIDTDKKSNNHENIIDENNNQQNYYYFNYENSYNLRNYYSKKTGKTSFSTEQNTAKKNYNNAEVNSFKEVENQINEAIKTNKEIIENISKKKEKYYKNNFIDDKEDSNKNTNINTNINTNNNTTNQNSNEVNKYNNMKKIRYINDIDSVNIYNNIENKNPFPFKRNNFENKKINSNNLYQKENDINILNYNMENNNLNNNISFNNNIENNESNNFNNYIYNQENTNTNNNSYNNIEMISYQKNIVEESDMHLNTKNSQQTTINNITYISSDSMNINTLESINIRKIDEEEQKLTMEIEKERQRLNQLEQEKMKLIIEEQERRQKILEEIENQEKKEKEKQRKMRKKYEESLMKKKEDEEKLKQLKIEQGKQLKEINELIYKRQQDEEKFVLLAEGKLNKFQRKTYRNSLRNEKNKSNVNLNKLPFDIVIKDKNKKNYENNGQQIIKRMKNNFIVNKDSRLWNVSDKKANNFNENNKNNEERKNIFQNRKMLSESRGFKSYQNLNNYNNNNNTNSMNNNKINNKDKKMKNERMTIDTMTKINEFMSFSPSVNHKKNMFRLSPTNIMDNNNKLNTELEQQIITFSPLLNKEDYTNSINNVEYKEKNLNNNDIPENNKYPYQKKINKYYKNMNINIQKNIDNSSNKNHFIKKNKNLNEKNNSNKNNIINEDDDLNSINELKEIKKITSKMANEIEKKIEIINRNKHNSKHAITKTKSTPKLNSFLKVKNNQNKSDYNYEMNNNEDIINKNENSKVNKNQFKKSYIELTNNIINKEVNFQKQKTFIEEYLLPNNIKKECLKEINIMDKDNNSRQEKGNNQMNLENYTYRNNKYLIRKTLDFFDKKGKKEKKLNNDSKNYSGRQRSYYNEFLYGNERDMYCNLGNY